MPPPSQQPNQTSAHLDPTTYPRTQTDQTLNTHLTLTYAPLDATQALQLTSSPSAGANVLFLGTTRDSFDDRPVTQLSYTTYPVLALKTLQRIAAEAVQKHGLMGLCIAHRLGVVPVGEASIAVAVSAPHRGAAWRAGEEVLEVCKERLEVWKREVFGDGEGDGEGQWKSNRDWDREGNKLRG